MAEAGSIHPWVSSMAAVHQIYRTSLDAAPAYIGSARGNRPRRALIANFYSNVLASVETHHIGEDELYFPLLIERASDEQAQVVELGLEEHEHVRSLAEAAKAAIAAWVSTGDAEGPKLVLALRALNETLSIHCDHEEAAIVPLAIMHLSEEEWNKLGPHGAANFKGDKFWLIVGLRLECSSPEERTIVLNHMAPDTREWWETTGEPSFNDLIAQIRGAD